MRKPFHVVMRAYVDTVVPVTFLRRLLVSLVHVYVALSSCAWMAAYVDASVSRNRAKYRFPMVISASVSVTSVHLISNSFELGFSFLVIRLYER